MEARTDPVAAGPVPEDVLRAFAQLQPRDDATCARIAVLLGAVPPADDAVEAAAPGTALLVPDLEPAPSRGAEQSVLEAVPDLDVDELTAPEGDVVRSSLLPVRDRRTEGPHWLHEPVRLDALVPAPPRSAVERSLFAPQQSRGVLTVAFAAPADSRRLDIEAAVRTIAGGRELDRLPYVQAPTLARGVQLLVDRSDSMLPFSSDVDRLERAVRALVGGEALSALRFTGCPTRGAGTGSKRRWKPYAAPASGTTVVVASDLGIGEAPGGRPAAGTEEWLDFAQRVARAGCPLVAIVPYPPARWPPELAARLHILQWDRATTAATAARAVRDRPRTAAQVTPDRTEERIDDEARRLASRAAFAARVDPGLLRELRLQLLPELDAGVEADVWFAPEVRFRGKDGFVFAPEASARLREQLRAEGAAAYDAAWEVTRRSHANAPAAIRLEEELRYLEQRGTPAAQLRTVELTQAAVAAVMQGGPELASWGARAHAGLSEASRAEPEAAMLAAAARMRLPRHLDGGETLPAGPLQPWVQWIASTSQSVELGVRLLEHAIELSEPPAPRSHHIAVPLTRPLVVELVQSGVSRRVDLERGQTRPFSVSAGPVIVRVATGEEFELAAQATVPPTPWAGDGVAEGSRLLRILAPDANGYPVTLHVADGTPHWLERAVASETLPADVASVWPPGMSAAEAGGFLDELLISGEVRYALDDQPPEEGAGLYLDIRPPELRRLPWELMRAGARMRFADPSRPAARVAPHFPVHVLEQSSGLLRVVMVVGTESGDPGWGVGDIEEPFLPLSGFVDVEVLVHPTHAEVRQACRELRPQILHVAGDSRLGPDGPRLMITGQDGSLWDWRPENMAVDIDPAPGLVVLDLLHATGSEDPQAPWRHTDELLAGGARAVVARQIPQDEAQQPPLIAAFYRAVLDGEPVDVALCGARAKLDAETPASTGPWAPALTLAAAPAQVLPPRFAVAASQAGEVERVSDIQTFVGRNPERRALWQATDGSSGSGGVVVVSGDPQLGKSLLARWCVTLRASRGENAVYVDCGRAGPGRLDFAAVLRLIADDLAASPVHGERNRAAFERVDVTVGEGERAVDLLLEAFDGALAQAAGGQPLVIALDHIGHVEAAHWSSILVPWLSRLTALPAPVRVVTILGPGEPAPAPALAVIRMEPFPAGSLAPIIGRYLRARGHAAQRVDALLGAIGGQFDRPWSAQEFSTWERLVSSM